jgi:hypothetical protein
MTAAMGRRSKYTPDVVNALIDALELGMIDGDACLVAGISEKTFYEWQATKSAFRDLVTCARAKGWKSDLAVIKKAAIESRDWRAAAEHLDRTRSPYRKSTDVNVTMQIRKRAEQIADQLGVPVDELMAEAEAVASGAWDKWSPT